MRGMVASKGDVIYRYEILIDAMIGTTLHLSDLRQVVKVAGGDDWVEFWAIVCPGYTTHRVEFAVIGTGHPIPEGWTYEGTADRTPKGFVWHLISKRVDE